MESTNRYTGAGDTTHLMLESDIRFRVLTQRNKHTELTLRRDIVNEIRNRRTDGQVLKSEPLHGSSDVMAVDSSHRRSRHIDFCSVYKTQPSAVRECVVRR
ncbi:hypothetical protein EVAR_4346_1 [Eumeta japonica]|uniref:Uncharacterized protein n=1 Tax=Eumeta variegata TaxID=151549 RepID=A0A4C1VBF8_EUMVA|nr:hypothetical protein EVAR_4346_1 [Eumeta japonica]